MHAMKKRCSFRLPADLLSKARDLAPLARKDVTAIVEDGLRAELARIEENLDTIIAAQIAHIKGN